MAHDGGFKFGILHNASSMSTGPRIGRLILPNRTTISTPNFLALTSRGVVPHITPDLLASHTRIHGVHLALEDFIERKSTSTTTTTTPPILSCPSGSEVGSTPIHNFTALPNEMITVLSPRRTPAITTPNPNTDSSISIYTSTGFQTLALDEYIKICSVLQPDIVIPLADLMHNVAPGVKRIARMGDKTKGLVAGHLDALSSTSSSLSSDSRQQRRGQNVFAPVLPIPYTAQAEYLEWIADETCDEIAGLAFYDAELVGEMPATSSLTGKCRLSMDEASGPLRLLREIGWGVDLCTCPFVGTATDSGVALAFDFPASKGSDDGKEEREGGLEPLGLDMWSPTHSTSLLPLSPNCKCYTCTVHHKAYVQHLLSAKEMLGWVLLQIHNHHIISRFFEGIRTSIQAGRFDEDCKDFEKRYESELPGGGGMGPRVRGYHFKTEGPGEVRRNRPAWGNLGGEERKEEDGLVPDEGGEGLEAKGFAEVTG